MISFRSMLLLGVPACVVLFLWAANQKKPSSATLDQRFETNEEGWIGFGQNARVHVTHDRANVKEGAGALELDYKIVRGQAGSAVLLINDGSLRRMKRLRFWAKSDSSTTIAVVLSEKKPQGGDYVAWFWSPKDKWQLIELRPSDFCINEGSSDPNGRLDTDQVQGVGLIDLAQFFITLSGSSDFPLVVTNAAGDHAIYMDNFAVLMEGPDPPATADRVPLDDFRRDFVTWITLGGVDLSLSRSGNPLNKPALEATYEQMQGRYVVFSHGLLNFDLRNTKGLVFDIASSQPAKLMMYLEEKVPTGQGSRYNYQIDLPGGRKVMPQKIAFSQFAHDATSPAASGFDPGKLKTLSILDITGAFGATHGKNTVWIADLAASRR